MLTPDRPTAEPGTAARPQEKARDQLHTRNNIVDLARICWAHARRRNHPGWRPRSCLRSNPLCAASRRACLSASRQREAQLTRGRQKEAGLPLASRSKHISAAELAQVFLTSFNQLISGTAPRTVPRYFSLAECFHKTSHCIHI